MQTLALPWKVIKLFLIDSRFKEKRIKADTMEK